jgi:hypothetical protein
MVRLMRGLTTRKLLYVAIALLMGASTLGATGLAVAAQTRWFIDESKLPFTPIGNSQALWGVHAGAGYRIEVPENWNGDLVLYARGYLGNEPELKFDDAAFFSTGLRNILIARNYAWAASTYSANGYVAGVGAKDTHKLIGLFKGLVENPNRVYITGHSMGGHVIGLAIEQWPTSFVGAMPLCGNMGDIELFNFLQDAYLLAEWFAGNEPAVPTPADYFTAQWPNTKAVLGNPFPSNLTPAGQMYKTAVKYLTGGERPTFDQGFAWPLHGGAYIFDIGKSARTGPMRDNIETVYQLDDDPAMSAEEISLNEMIPRIAAEPQYLHPNGLGGWPGTEADCPPISGDIRIPVLSMHNLSELNVPFSMEQIYARRVAAHGASDLLVTRAIRVAYHCWFSVEELAAAFDDLVKWVENGEKPAGDDVLNPVAVADPAFGCQFTNPVRALTSLPPCPP